MENIPDKICFKDTQSRFIRASKAHARTFGLRNATEAMGKTDTDFFSEEHAKQAYEDEQRIIRTCWQRSKIDPPQRSEIDPP